MKQVTAIFLRGTFFFIVGVIFATLFVWSLVEGILSHMRNGQFTFIYYFAAWLSGVGAFTLYIQAKSILHYAKISK